MSNPTAHHRPFLVTFLSLIVLGLALLGWARLVQSIRDWAILAQRVGAWLPVYAAVGGCLWGLTGLPAVWGIWQRSLWVKRAVWTAALAYPGAYWVDLLFLASSPESKGNLVFSAGATLVWLVLVFFILSRRNTLDYLRGNGDESAKPRSAS